MEVREPPSELLAEDRGERRAGRLDDGHIDAKRPRRGCDLLPDETGAHHREAHAGRQRGAQGTRFSDRAQHVNVVESLGPRQPARRRPRRYQEIVVEQLLSARGADQPHGRLERDGAATQEQLDLLVRYQLGCR